MKADNRSMIKSVQAKAARWRSYEITQSQESSKVAPREVRLKTMGGAHEQCRDHCAQVSARRGAARCRPGAGQDNGLANAKSIRDAARDALDHAWGESFD